MLPLKTVMKQTTDLSVLRSNLQAIEKHLAAALDQITAKESIDVHYYLYSFLKYLLADCFSPGETGAIDKLNKCEDIEEALSLL